VGVRREIILIYIYHDLCGLVYLCQELFLMLFREAGENIFKIALVTENVTLSNPGI
jgi:hypothetical protein